MSYVNKIEQKGETIQNKNKLKLLEMKTSNSHAFLFNKLIAIKLDHKVPSLKIIFLEMIHFCFLVEEITF